MTFEHKVATNWFSAFLLLLITLTSGCTFLPAAGPLSSEVASVGKDDAVDGAGIKVFSLDSNVTSALTSYQGEGLSHLFHNHSARPQHVIGVGDVISVVVWEPGQDGLFANATTGGRAELGPFLVDQVGRISVPYVGWVTAKGRTLAQLRWAVLQGLQDKAVDPQVVIALQENASSVVAVNGAVRQPGVHPVGLNGARILDVIALSGGVSQPVPELEITFIRKGKKGSQRLKAIFDNLSENIFVKPGDQIFINHKPETFTAFGAVPRVNEYPITGGDVSLTEALGRIGGLDDNRANSVGLFVFRYEAAEIVAQFDPSFVSGGVERVPVIYRVNMREQGSYFLAQAFKMRDNDIVYVANSYGSELRKFIGIVSGLTGQALPIAAVVSDD